MVTSRTVVVAHPGMELYGSDRVLLDSVIAFLDDGRRVIVSAPAEGPLAERLRAAGAEVTIAPQFVLRKRLIKPRAWPEFFLTAWKGFRASWRLLRQENPAVVYVSTITLPLWPVLARLRGARVVLHVHEGEASASRIIKKALYTPALFAHQVIVNSAFSREVMASTYKRLTSRSVVLLNAVSGPTVVTPLREQLIPGPRLLYVGRLSPRKGPDLVIDALRILDSRGVAASLAIVGSTFEGYEWFEESLHEAIARAGLERRVKMYGFRADVWSFVESCDIFVVPSRYDEPFGNTAIEGALGERPVIVSDTSGLREATAGVGTVYRVAPNSAAALADAVEAISARWHEMREGVSATRNTMAQRHSTSRYQETLTRLVFNDSHWHMQ
ncbi:glycosyltransferase [Microbacterium sp. KR10-403]|uniref:glycosyltransferase n=1 Tax=Microbacterium sp. KR10-403 TaxID=3158581 RepID=UPI0032E3A0AD